jgi:tetratricopeptide (TPR) repeat protein
LGETETAINTLNDGISINPIEYHGYQALGRLFMEADDPAAALEVYQSALDLIPGESEIFVGIGDVYLTKVYDSYKLLDLAKAFEQSALQRLETKAEAKKTALKKREIKKADLTYVLALDDYEIYFNKLLAAEQNFKEVQTDIDQANSNYYKALDIQPNNGAALLGLGKLSLVSGLKEDALQYFYQASAADPNAILPSFYLGHTYHDLKQYDEAIDVFQILVEIDPNDVYANLGILRSYSELENIDLAQGARSVEHHQFIWESMIDKLRLDN